MKLSTYNPENTPVVRRTDPAIRVDFKHGVFCINKSAYSKMKIGGGDKIILHQDEENPENWFLQNVGKKGNGFETRIAKDKSEQMLFNNATLGRKIADSVAFDGNSGKILIGEMISVKGVGEIWTLITAGLRNK
jgi:hypothetical protein